MTPNHTANRACIAAGISIHPILYPSDLRSLLAGWILHLAIITASRCGRVTAAQEKGKAFTRRKREQIHFLTCTPLRFSLLETVPIFIYFERKLY